MTHSIHEWQVLSLKKDIEHIRMYHEIPKSSELFFTSEIFLMILSLLIDHFLDDESSYRVCAQIVCITIIVIIFLGWLFSNLIKIFQQWYRIHNNKLPVQEYIDLFDNSVCYYAMTAKNYLVEYLNCTSILPEEREFYFIEANYYINKSIQIITQFDSKVEKIISLSPSDSKEKSIQYERFVNTVELLKNIRESLYDNSTTEYQGTMTLAYKYDRLMDLWVMRTNRTLQPKGKCLSWTSNAPTKDTE